MSNARNLSDLLGTGSTVATAKIADDAITSAKIKDNLLRGTNLLINGGMQISQRGQTFTSISSNQYTCDRWFYQISGSGGRGTATQETSGGPAGFKDNFLRVTVTNTDSTVAADDIILVKQVLEGHVAAFTDQGTADAQDLTLSFYVRSSITGTFSATLLTNFSPTPASHPKNYTINSANTWERKVITFPGYTTSKTLVSSGYTNGEYMQVRFALLAGSNRTGTADQWNLANDFATTSQINFFANSSATWDITGCQLQVGSITDPEFEHRSFGETLTRCQRYFSKSYNYDVAPGTVSGAGQEVQRTVTQGGGYTGDTFDFPVAMRTGPTMTFYLSGNANTAGQWNINHAGGTAAVTATVQDLGTSGCRADITGGISAWTACQVYGHWVADAEL